MKIKVLVFAQLREVFGSSEKVLDVAKGSTAGEVAQSLFSAQHPFVYAVNEEFAGPETFLSEGDTLALMTPVSGG